MDARKGFQPPVESAVWNRFNLTPPTPPTPPPIGRSSATPPEPTSGWNLDHIYIENFKSYRNPTRIGPLKNFPFIAIIGANGAGKSNLMDAISFVMGERNSSLRVKRLDDLIHGASIGKPTATTAKVSAVFKKVNEDLSQSNVTFTRVIRGASSDYIVNGKNVTQQVYLRELKTLGINAKGKNFLVFQGAIESVALKNSKERTALFEELCGSIDLKEEYEQAKTRLTVAEKKTENAYMKKRAILSERREVKMEVEEAKCYNDLLEEVAEKETEIALFRLHYIGIDINTKTEEHRALQNTARRLELKKQELLEFLEAEKKERGELSREQSKMEVVLQKMKAEKSKKMPDSITVKQKRKHIEKKLQNVEKSLKQAEENKKNQQLDVKRLQENLEAANKKLEAFLKLHEDSIGDGADFDVSLQDSQILEYMDLKREALRKSLDDTLEKRELERQKKDKDQVFYSANREKMTFEANLDITEHQIKEEKRLAQKLVECITELEEQLETKEAELHPLQAQFKDAEEKIVRLEKELEALTVEISNAKMDRYTIKRNKQKLETIAALKSHFKGVYDRVTNLCDPVHPKFKVAMAKIIGKRMEAIVVDSERTARQCIQYLKEQMTEPEVFLPIDLLQVLPLKTRFRDLKNQGISLAYDLLQIKNKEVEKAILHCTKSAVICPTTELARNVAAGEFLNDRTDAVSMQGTMYYTNGIISGGMSNLQRKACKWDDQKLNEKENRRLQIKEELREAFKVKRNAILIRTLEVEVAGLKKRIEYADKDKVYHIEKGKEYESKRKRLLVDSDNIMNRWKKAKEDVDKLSEQIKVYTKRINAVQDKVFAQFCKGIGIPNIRAYEENDVRKHEELKREKQEFERKIQEIQAQIEDEYNQTETLDGNLKRWKDVRAEIMGSLTECKREEKQIDDEIAVIDKKIAKIQDEFNEIKQNTDAKAKEISATSKKMAEKEKLLIINQKELTRLETSINQIKLRRHEIYKHCKFSGITLPFISGSFDDVHTGNKDSNTSQNFDDSIAIEEEILLDFQGLAEELKGLEGSDVKKTEDKLEKVLHETERKIAAFQGPNMKADKRWESINTKARLQQEEFDEVRKEAREARLAFDDVKKRRFDKFMACYETVAKNIDGIYKDLTQNNSAQAILGLENPQEPYLDGVSYNCVAPGKRFQSMNNLSGGEKTLAALALLFAIQSYEPAPFFVLDEIDAALDNTNIEKVASYMRRKSRNLQILVISLKEEFFEDSDALVGIAPDVEPSDCVRSKVYTLDLTKYLNN